IHERLPWSLIEEICVMNETTQGEVGSTLRDAPYQPPVNIRRAWYY
ncbi:MAG: DUF4433 domain-containing protein, partial [Desulfatitalea sp.]|nr:DUF4433 domain-containing protein [Desulfatitalea sp.]